MLVSHLVNQKANEGEDHFVEDGSEDALVCPRCQQSQARVYVDHGLNHLFKRVTKYIFTCDYCGVDETV
jgi:C4-type Zn-finger protein